MPLKHPVSRLRASAATALALLTLVPAGAAAAPMSAGDLGHSSIAAPQRRSTPEPHRQTVITDRAPGRVNARIVGTVRDLMGGHPTITLRIRSTRVTQLGISLPGGLTWTPAAVHAVSASSTDTIRHLGRWLVITLPSRPPQVTIQVSPQALREGAVLQRNAPCRGQVMHMRFWITVHTSADDKRTLRPLIDGV